MKAISSPLQVEAQEPPATTKQIEFLMELGVKASKARTMTKTLANKTIQLLLEQPTRRQKAVLKRLNYTQGQISAMTREEATEVIGKAFARMNS